MTAVRALVFSLFFYLWGTVIMLAALPVAWSRGARIRAGAPRGI